MVRERRKKADPKIFELKKKSGHEIAKWQNADTQC